MENKENEKSKKCGKESKCGCQESIECHCHNGDSCGKDCKCGCHDGGECRCHDGNGCHCGGQHKCCCKKAIVAIIVMLLIFLAGMGFNELIHYHRYPLNAAAYHKGYNVLSQAGDYTEGKSGNIIIINTDGRDNDGYVSRGCGKLGEHCFNKECPYARHMRKIRAKHKAKNIPEDKIEPSENIAVENFNQVEK